MMIKAVLFDFDDVIRLWPSENDRLAEMAGCLPAGVVEQAAFLPELIYPAMIGQVTDEQWRQSIIHHLKKKYPEALVEQAVVQWSSSAGTINQPVLDMARACRQKAQVILITNGTSRVPKDLRWLGIAGDFDHIVNAAEVGYAKPAPEIYEYALGLADVTPAEALFVDNSISYIEGATKLGLHCHHFQDVSPLKQFLEAYRVL